MNEKLIEQMKAFELDLMDNEMAKNSIVVYMCGVRTLLEFLGDDELDQRKLIDYKDYLSNKIYDDKKNKTYKKTTINKYIVSVNKFMFFIDNPIRIKKLRLQNLNIDDDVINHSDYTRLLESAKKLGKYDDYLIIQILANVGIRADELKHFTFENLKTSITVTNKGKSRIVPIRKELLSDLRKYCKYKGIKKGVIFYAANPEKIMDKSTVWKRLKRISAHAKINKEKIHPHAFRKYFAREYTEQGGNIWDLASILGHSNIKTTQGYLKKTGKEVRSDVRKMRYKR